MRSVSSSAIATLSLLFLGACAHVDKGSVAEAEDVLTGTTWRLAEFQSSDDSSGIKRPGPGEEYELNLMAGGKVTMRVACNRGMGQWNAPDRSRKSGFITFSAMALTRAACINATMDAQVARDMGNVRSYVLKDDKLYLSLLADGGTYEWVPAVEAK